jgi:hypothetical protein
MQQVQLNDEELNFNNKDHLIEEFSIRWWFSLPKWPPENYDYTEKLLQHRLRKVELKNWKME